MTNEYITVALGKAEELAKSLDNAELGAFVDGKPIKEKQLMRLKARSMKIRDELKIMLHEDGVPA